MKKDEYYTPEPEKSTTFNPVGVGGVTMPRGDAQKEMKNNTSLYPFSFNSTGTFKIPFAPKIIHIYGSNCFGIWTKDSSNSFQFTGIPISISTGLRGLIFSVSRDEITVTANPSSLSYSFYCQ